MDRAGGSRCVDGANVHGGRKVGRSPGGVDSTPPRLRSRRGIVLDFGGARARGTGGLSVQETPTISPAEAEMLEQLRQRLHPSVPAPPLPHRPPPVEESLHQYSIRVIDDTNMPISGVRLKLDIEGTPRMPTTDPDGCATAEWYSRACASAWILGRAELEQRLEARWREPVSAQLPEGDDVYRLAVRRPWKTIFVPPDPSKPVTIIVARPQVVRTRLIGGYFETSKCFLLPGAMHGIRGVKRQYDRHPGANVLVIGHTDTTGNSSYNDALSMERAESVSAYLAGRLTEQGSLAGRVRSEPLRAQRCRRVRAKLRVAEGSRQDVARIHHRRLSNASRLDDPG